MSKIEVLREAQRRLANAEKFFGMIGSKGYADQMGRLHQVELRTFTVYFQPFSGDKNYHNPDEFLFPEIAAAIGEHGPAIGKTVIKKLQQRVEDAATAAKQEALEVIALAEKAVEPVQPESHE
jgi:hypothetical protein